MLWALAVVVLLFLVLLAVASRREPEGGWVKERFAPCPSTPNCVSSRATRARHRIAPLTGEGDPQALFRRAADAVRGLPRTRVVSEEAGYLHAECASALFRFVDDLELELDAERGVVHVRSAARIGRGDLGVNRRRVERIRAALAD